MRNSFAALDDTLFERLFQPISDVMAHYVGLGRSSTACFCIDAASLSWIVSREQGLSVAMAAWDAGYALLGLFVLLCGLAAMISLRTLFRRANGGKANPLRQIMQPHRAVVLLMLVARLAQLRSHAVADFADLAMLLCAASALYLGACVERPRIRRGLTSTLASG